MKKAHVWFGLCLLLALVSFSATPAAQVAPENETMAGDGMDEATAGFVAALKTEDYAAMFDSLASWKQNAVGLSQERLNNKIADGSFTEETAKAWLKKQDPTGETGIKTLEDLKAAHPAKFLALKSGMVLLLVNEQRKKNRLNWYVVEHQVGLVESGNSDLRIMPWGGYVRYENSVGDSISFTLSLEKGKWKVTNYTLKVGAAKLGLDAMLRQDIGAPRAWSSMEKARAAEGIQLLGSARDYCRVEYSKTGSENDVTTGFNEQVSDGNFDGKYYKVTEYIKALPNSKHDAAVVAHPTSETDPWLIMLFDWASGNSTIEWCDDKAALDTKIRDLTTEEK